EERMKEMEKEILRRTRRGNSPLFGGKALALLLGASGAENEKERGGVRLSEIDDKPPGSFRKKSARGCMFMGNKQIKEIRFGKLGGSQSLFLSSRGARPFF